MKRQRSISVELKCSGYIKFLEALQRAEMTFRTVATIGGTPHTVSSRLWANGRIYRDLTSAEENDFNSMNVMRDHQLENMRASNK